MIGDGEAEGQSGVADANRPERLDGVEAQGEGTLGKEERVGQEEVAPWDDKVDVPRWHPGQTITGRPCENRSCERPHWTLHASAPLVLSTRPTTAEALRRASEEMRR